VIRLGGPWRHSANACERAPTKGFNVQRSPLNPVITRRWRTQKFGRIDRNSKMLTRKCPRSGARADIQFDGACPPAFLRLPPTIKRTVLRDPSWSFTFFLLLFLQFRPPIHALYLALSWLCPTSTSLPYSLHLGPLSLVLTVLISTSCFRPLLWQPPS
jgi:hypothetical protein